MSILTNPYLHLDEPEEAFPVEEKKKGLANDEPDPWGDFGEEEEVQDTAAGEATEGEPTAVTDAAVGG